jgi:hypothetical protein
MFVVLRGATPYCAHIGPGGRYRGIDQDGEYDAVSMLADKFFGEFHDF